MTIEEVATITIIILYFIGAIYVSSRPPKQVLSDLRRRLLSSEGAAAVLLFIGVFVIIFGFFFIRSGNPSFRQVVEDFYANFGAEFVSIAITVFIIDRLNRRRQAREEKAQMIQRWREEIEDYRSWKSDEAKYRIVGNVKRLNRENISDICLIGAYLPGARLSEADLNGADLYGANLQGAVLQKAILGGTNLNNANLQGAYLQGAYLQQADLNGADLRGSKLQRTGLQGVDLSGALLDEADLSGANLSSANLCQADLELADLRGIKLEGTIYNNKTVWPDGFDPKAAGAINVDEKGQ